MGRPSVGPVNPTSRKYGSTGSSTPTERAIAGDHAPAAQTTVEVSTAPRDVSTALTSVPSSRHSRHSAAGDHGRAVAPRSGRIPLRYGLGARVAVERAVGRRQHAIEAGDRAQLADLAWLDEAARDAELVLERDARLERRDVVGAIEEEEVPDLVEVDLGARPLGEPRERLDAPQPDRDVERIRELGAKAPGGAARGSARELIALEQADIRACLREVERDARPDDASTDDDHVGGCGQRAHRRTRFLRKKPRFAGRSASLRMRYGYQSGPNGDATSTLYPSAAIERCSPGRTP